MLYAIRNAEGRIVSLSETPQPDSDQVSIRDKEVLQFLSIESDGFSAEDFLEQSDTGVARIFEDLVDVLIQKNLILFTDLPEMAQKKLLGRKLARNYNSQDEPIDQPQTTSSFLIDDEDTI
ncbi:MAG: hypothetical protein ACRBB6_13800 [Neptuniibacter sp.]